MRTKLGNVYRDIITGFSGVATARSEYITGCNQVLLQPRMLEGGKKIEPEWFDEQRVEEAEGERVVIDNGMTPGFDKAAPRR